MKTKTILLFFILSVSLMAKDTLCYSYNPSDFYIDIKKINQENYKVIKEYKKRLKSLEIYFSKKDLYEMGSNTKYKSAIIGYRYNRHKFYFTMAGCEKLKEDKYPRCFLECDKGNFKYKKDFSFQIDRDYNSLIFNDSEDTYEVSLVQKSKGKFIQAKKIECPKNISKLFTNYNEDDDSKSKNSNGNYVCYEYKYLNDNGKWEYENCNIYLKHCKEYGRLYFGHYPSKKATKLALKRCEKGTPNPEYVDNPKGKYVCYDYIDIFGNYKGCFRSIKSCKKLKKEQFGKYGNRVNSKDAFIRCNASLPLDRE